MYIQYVGFNVAASSRIYNYGAAADLSIRKRDVDEYLEQHYPRQLLAKKAASGR